MSMRINTTTNTSFSFKSSARLIAAHAALLATLVIAAPAHAGLLGGAGGGGGGSFGGNIGGSLGGTLNGLMSGLQRPDLGRAKDKLAETKAGAVDKAADGQTQGGTALAGVQDKLAQAKDSASTMPATTPATPATAAPASPSTNRSLTAEATSNASANRDGASAGGNASVRGSASR